MKLCKLKLKNLNSFRREIEIDFENSPLDDATLVAITGPTGAGKTTLLDAICVALFAKTPRLSGNASQNPIHLISHGEKEGFAEVHFISNGTGYMAEWSGKINGSPKGRLLIADSNELISDRLSTKGKSLGSSKKIISEEVTSLIGLDFNAFKRSVMLAQGEFAAFLKTTKENRRTILEAVANVGIYEKLRDALNEKVRKVEEEHKEVLQELEAIPDASSKQLAEEEAKLEELQREAKKLGMKSERKLSEKGSETKRKEDYEKLQNCKQNQEELENQQSIIDTYKLELSRAERANQLLQEKSQFDTTKLNYDQATEVLKSAEKELENAINQENIAQVEFDGKKKEYQSASTDRDEKIKIYNQAKLDVERASERFNEANRRMPSLTELNEKIDTLSGELADEESRQNELQEQIKLGKTYLEENPLPSDRQSRLIRLTAILGKIKTQIQQREEKIETQLAYTEKTGELEGKLVELKEDKEKLQSQAETAAEELKHTEEDYNTLMNNGTLEDWQQRRIKATQAQPIALSYEAIHTQLCEETEKLVNFQEEITSLDESLDEISNQIDVQTQICKRADAEVAKLEAERELAILAAPTNQLRQQLVEGQPCRVCGATEHPFAHKDNEVEGDQLLDSIEHALHNAQTDANVAAEKQQNLEQEQVRLKQNKSNAITQIESCQEDINQWNTELNDFRSQWQEIYVLTDISSDWVQERIEEAITSIDNLNKTHTAFKEAKTKAKSITQELTTCERDITRESNLLDDTKENLDTVTDEIEDLKLQISDNEGNFWESIPSAFRDNTPEVAVQQFEEKITEVENRQDQLRTAEEDLRLLNSRIESDQKNLRDLENRSSVLQEEIQQFKDEGDSYLNAVREKTNGLETEDVINQAINDLEVNLQTKKDARDEAEENLLEIQKLSAQKQTAKELSDRQYNESVEKFETARDVYNDKLKDEDFNSPKDHTDAIRDETQTQELRDRIVNYDHEKQQLEVEIVALRTQFNETPFDPDLLPQILTVIQEISTQTQAIQQNIGAQEQRINSIKEDLKKREELDSKVQAAKQEMERWQRLKDTIPSNHLRDFALEVMFQQVSRIANIQLAFLTSDRYQLEVEDIGKLTVIDRWNANEKRPVETLSGGESFLTSLALALALSEISQGRAQLNSLFLDEGFGTLDAETLDIAIASLEGLRMQGRSIYLISHIQELTRRLPVKIHVKKHGDGSSSIDIRD